MLLLTGQGTEFILPANDSAVNWFDLTGQTMHMPGMKQPFRWDFDDEMEDEIEDEDGGDGGENDVKGVRYQADNAVTKRYPAPRTILEHTITPLLKRATS